jgi:hypothetical protein
MEKSHFIDRNDEKKRELRETLLDTNSTNYHEGFERRGELVQIREIRVSISASS